MSCLFAGVCLKHNVRELQILWARYRRNSLQGEDLCQPAMLEPDGNLLRRCQPDLTQLEQCLLCVDNLAVQQYKKARIAYGQ